MSGGAAVKSDLTFDEAWPILQEEGIDKIIGNFEGVHSHQFTSEEYMRLYTSTVYNVCQPDPVGPEVQKLYDQYKWTFEDNISTKVLPSLRGKKNQELLQELLRRWNNHKIMKRWLTRFFHYLDRYFTAKKNLPSLVETSNLAFYNLVYNEINHEVRGSIISLIEREREGEQIDEAMVREILDIYVEIGDGSQKYYVKDFEEAFVNATYTYYSKKALDWIANKSYVDYMLKVEDCLNQENTIASNYLKFGSKHKILEVVQHELLTVHASKLEEMKHLHGGAV